MYIPHTHTYIDHCTLTSKYDCLECSATTLLHYSRSERYSEVVLAVGDHVRCCAAQEPVVTPAVAVHVDLQPEIDRLNAELKRLRAELDAMR